MNWEAVGSIGEIVGATAVVLTLIYLAVQMRQNTASVKASALQVWAGLVSAPSTAVQTDSMAAAVATGITAPENLKGHQWVQYGLWNHQLMYVTPCCVDLIRSKVHNGFVIRTDNNGMNHTFGHPHSTNHPRPS